MKIFIRSYNRPTTQPLWALIKDQRYKHDIKVILHGDHQRHEYIQGGIIPSQNIIVTPATDVGPHRSREFARTQTAPGEWALLLDDDIERFFAPDLQYYLTHDRIPRNTATRDSRPIMNIERSFDYVFHSIVEDTLAEAERRGAQCCSFAMFENPWFRPRKFKDLGVTYGQMLLIKNTGLLWDQTDGGIAWAMEDYAFGAAQYLEYGRILVNNFLFPVSRLYMPGGCGLFEQRLPQKLIACENIMSRWPGFARKHPSKPGDLRIRFTALNKVQQWRARFMSGTVANPNAYDAEYYNDYATEDIMEHGD